MSFKDQSLRFIFEDAPVRGEFINLTDAYQEILKRQPYPLPVQMLLGQTLAAASLLSATLKYQGSLIIQAQGNGPVSLLLAQANHQKEIRGLATWEGKIPENFQEAVGSGHLAITINPGFGDKRYQGIIELSGNHLAEVLEKYFQQSEQLPTVLLLASNEKVAAGFLLQLLPKAKPHDDDFWHHVVTLARTLTDRELLELSPDNILHRLYHQEKIAVFDPENVSFVCRCSRDAMAKAILTLGHEDAVKLATLNKVVSVKCEFCNKEITFDRIDIERIFKDHAADDDRILH